ncbi:MAG: hypothetical protein NTU43_08165 [Bacteroidetes bacterium]|nr:hypothetical protein [Bacteroidota bacterium]
MNIYNPSSSKEGGGFFEIYSMENLKQKSKIVLCIGIIVCIIPIIIYISKFGTIISNDKSDWGTFGDYLGGVLNPIIGLLNILFLFFISKYVSELDKHRHFNEYRYRAYIELCKQFVSSSNLTSEELTNLLVFLKEFKGNHNFLFHVKEENKFDSLMQSIIEDTSYLLEKTKIIEEEKAIPILENIGKMIGKASKNVTLEKHDNSILEKFNDSKKSIIKFIQDVMIGVTLHD